MGNTNTFTSKQRLDLATTYGDCMVDITENTATIKCRNLIDDDTIIPQIDAISNEQFKQSNFNKVHINKQLCQQAYVVFQKNSCDDVHQYKRIYFHDKTMQALFVLENENPTRTTNQSMCIDIVATVA